MKEQVQAYLQESAQLKQTVAQEQSVVIVSMVQAVVDSYRQGGQVLAMGNGGSAADAQHFVAELVGRFRLERDPWPAMALTPNSSTVTAIANDYGYEQVFVRQVKAFARAGDVIVGISTSGCSANVIEAMKVAKDQGAILLGLTGLPGVPLLELCDHALVVPAKATSLVQEVHMAVLHLICQLVEEQLSA